MERYIEQAVEIVRQADEESYASDLAWLIGPAAFLRHLSAKTDRDKKRMAEVYDAVADNPGKP